MRSECNDKRKGPEGQEEVKSVVFVGGLTTSTMTSQPNWVIVSLEEKKS